MLHLETIAPQTLTLLQDIQKLPEFAQLRLVGGTALALQLGHRVSIDLDFFGDWGREVDLFATLRHIGKTRKESSGAKGRLQFFYVNGVKVDCVDYSEYAWLEPALEELNVRLAGVKDIAAMKINAITNRDTRKDFVDLAFLLDHYTLKEMFSWYCEKYPEATPVLALRSLSYFEDAEMEPLPRILLPFNWDEAKVRITKAVRTITLG